MTVRLDDPGLAWTPVPIPGSVPAVSLVRLHVAPTGASASLVRFPPGWARPGLGHYACAEEFVVLEGWLQVSGRRTAAGEYAFLPPRAERAASRVAPGGCLALAWFSGPPRWTDGSPPRPAEGPVRGGAVASLRREPSPEVPGRAEVRDGLTPAVDDLERDVLAPGPRTWAFVAAGAAAPAMAGPVLVREWAG